jgi:hypothetical protein
MISSNRIGNNLILLFLGLALVCGHVYAKASPATELGDKIIQSCDRNVNHFILDKLAANRIVMIGEAHGSSACMQRVVSVLNAWVDTLDHADAKTTQVPAKLYLFLERDSADVKGMYDYFKTGDISFHLEPGSILFSKFTTANIEFWSDLRSFVKRVDLINTKRSAENKIQFEIVGPEVLYDTFHNPMEASAKYFFFERDINSSNNIIKRLNDHPDYKGLIYYGGAHLSKVEELKSADTMSEYGYYMAYYLDREFGPKGGIYRIGITAPRTPLPWLDSAEAAPGTDYGIDDSVFAGVDLFEKTGHREHKGDGAIMVMHWNTREKPVAQVWSERIVSAVMNNLDSVADYSGDYRARYWPRIAAYMSAVSGLPIEKIDPEDRKAINSTIARWRKWHKTTPPDYVAEIDSLTIWKRLINLMASDTSQSDRYDTLIAMNLGMRPMTPVVHVMGRRIDQFRDSLTQNHDRIVTENLIHLLWVATPAEEKKAIPILQKLTGQRFATAKEWTIWWRGKQRGR